MRFELSGFVAEMHVLSAVTGARTPAVRLHDGWGFAPMTRALAQARLHIVAPPEPGFRHLSRALSDRGATASERGRIVFIEANFKGGLGEQAAVGWEAGHVALGPFSEGHFGQRGVPPISEWPINKALRFLGVAPLRGLDEFDTLKLGRHPRTESWLEQAPRLPAPSPSASSASIAV